MKTIEAVKTVARALRRDKGLYVTYQSNVAMAFKAEMQRRGYSFPDLHYAAETAAKNYLDLWINKKKRK